MGRPRGFDEAEVIRSAAGLFAMRSFDGTSVDDLVAGLSVHRNSLYKTFGSKRGLYLAALRWSLEHQVAPIAERVAVAADPAAALREASDDPGLDLLILAAVETAPTDAEVADLVAGALAGLDRACAGIDVGADGVPRVPAPDPVATLLGLRIRARYSPADREPAEVGATAGGRPTPS
ncbi:MAG: helix-turn-helix transcriptional regulator [Catenulispora sp.]|nr:helix-turn-helix transcriptional regulator [Catenulispora sp.]